MDRLAELAGYAQSFPGMVDEDFIAAGFSPDEVYSYRINQQAQSETARARELASMQEQRRARGQALAAQYPDYFRQGLETEPLYGINQRMSDIKAGAELTQDPNFARRQFARLATDLGLPLSLTESVLGKTRSITRPSWRRSIVQTPLYFSSRRRANGAPRYRERLRQFRPRCSTKPSRAGSSSVFTALSSVSTTPSTSPGPR